MGVLEALPAHALDYTPHPVSQTARAICETMVRCLHVCVSLTKYADVEMLFREHCTKDVLVAEFGRLSQELSQAIAVTGQPFWEEEVRVRANGTIVLEQPRGSIFWLFLFDAIHHRGQLTAYLRPMGGKVPSVYGKSADGTL
jgi:uncharacterized damage-inducible protein DinB